MRSGSVRNLFESRTCMKGSCPEERGFGCFQAWLAPLVSPCENYGSWSNVQRSKSNVFFTVSNWPASAVRYGDIV